MALVTLSDISYIGVRLASNHVNVQIVTSEGGSVFGKIFVIVVT
jgi:hypothetical protein